MMNAAGDGGLAEGLRSARKDRRNKFKFKVGTFSPLDARVENAPRFVPPFVGRRGGKRLFGPRELGERFESWRKHRAPVLYTDTP